MRKAISEIIVAVMLLMISVAIVGMAYVFIMNFQEQAKSEVQQSGAESFKRIGSCLQTVSFDGKTNNLYVKNCGRYPIENVSVFIDSKLSGSVPLNANQNEIKNITISTTAGIHEIKLLGDYASAAISVNVTNAGPVCSDGTQYGQCSASKPLYCSAGALVNKCSVCGCSSGTCQADESCAGGFDFSLSASPSSGSATQGSSAATSATATLASGTTQPVALSCSGLPAGASCSFVPVSVDPTASSALTISTLATTPAGTYPIIISGTGGSVTRTTSYSLTVNLATVWFNTSWNYRKPVSITGSASALTNYQVLVTVDTQSLITAGKMRSDCGDIRFTDSDKITPINYWIESGCNSASTKVWVKVPNVTASNVANTTLYMYYGNPSAASASNGANTFIDFTDFNDLNGFTQQLGSWSTSGGVLLTHQTVEQANTLRRDTPLPAPPYLVSTKTRITVERLNSARGILFEANNPIVSTTSIMPFISTETNRIYFNVDGDWAYNIYDSTPNTWYVEDIQIKSSDHFIKLYSDSNRAPLLATKTSIANTAGTGHYWGFTMYSSDADMEYDWVFVRKYASPEPSVLSVGTEQVKP